MERDNGQDWATILGNTLLQPLNMTSSGLLHLDASDMFAIEGLNTSQIGEPG